MEKLGYQVIRAAGSHGPWDLIAIKEGEPVRCIQIKRTKTSRGVKLLHSKFTPQVDYNPSQHYNHELWVWLDRVGWQGHPPGAR